jgi:hypothetical protein
MTCNSNVQYLQLASGSNEVKQLVFSRRGRQARLRSWFAASPGGRETEKGEQKEMQGTLRSTSLHRYHMQIQASASRMSYLMKPGQKLPYSDGDQCHGNRPCLTATC